MLKRRSRNVRECINMIPFSILDLCPVPQGATAADAWLQVNPTADYKKSALKRHLLPEGKPQAVTAWCSLGRIVGKSETGDSYPASLPTRSKPTSIGFRAPTGMPSRTSALPRPDWLPGRSRRLGTRFEAPIRHGLHYFVYHKA